MYLNVLTPNFENIVLKVGNSTAMLFVCYKFKYYFWFPSNKVWVDVK